MQFAKVYRQIKKYKKIVIARHVGPDPDCLASSFALKESILETFPNKKVYTVGTPVATFKYLGIIDKLTDDMYNDSLLIVLDTPDRRRVDAVEVEKFKYTIKIDHHPFVEAFCNYEIIDDEASSTAQLISDLIFKTPLKMNKEIAEKIFAGIVADTNRFLFDYTSPKTFEVVAKLIKKTNLNFKEIYNNLYMRPLKEKKFQGYIINNITITENGLGYIKITDDILKEYGVDLATAGNLINEFNFINELLVWVIFSEDKNNLVIKCSIRSRGPIINEIASHYQGGGHIYASGARFKSFDEINPLIEELEEACINFKAHN